VPVFTKDLVYNLQYRYSCTSPDFPSFYLSSLCRGYLAVTEEGKERLKEGGMEGAYLGPDGYVHIPGKRVTLYSQPSPTKEEMEKVRMLVYACVERV